MLFRVLTELCICAESGKDEIDHALPFTLEDLAAEDQKLKGWRLVKKIHEAALSHERDTYVDPATGYTVFTSR